MLICANFFLKFWFSLGQILSLTILCASLQIWDFHLGRSRGHEECGLLDADYGINDAGFVIKSYSKQSKETSFTNTKVLGEIYDINYSMAPEGITSFNVSLSNLSCIFLLEYHYFSCLSLGRFLIVP